MNSDNILVRLNNVGFRQNGKWLVEGVSLDVKKGKIDFKVEKNGIIHASVAKASFDSIKISENANELIQTIIKNIFIMGNY